MGDQSAIQWTDATWNPVTGCSKVSPGCAHCYAESLTQRFADAWGVPDLPWTPANAATNVRLHPERLDQPLRWRRPRMVFVNSMSDLFHEQVPDDFIAHVFAVMARANRHTFQVLTKRPERAKELLGGAWLQDEVDELCEWGIFGRPWPLSNVWLGTSIENRRFVHRADLLRETPAAVRFISAEPLLGPLRTYLGQWPGEFDGPELDLTEIDWLIVGGESGPGHRLMRPEWVRDLRNATRCSACDGTGAYYEQHGPGYTELLGCQDCMATGSRTAFFFKQWGGRTPKSGGRELDGRTWDEFPQQLTGAST